MPDYQEEIEVALAEKRYTEALSWEAEYRDTQELVEEA